MLSPRWRKVLGDAWLHKSRTFLVVLAVALGMTGAGALLDAWALVRTATTQTYLGSHPVSATLRVQGMDAEFLAAVRAIPEIGAVRTRASVWADAPAQGARLPVELFSYDDFTESDIGKLESLRGTWPPRDGEISIENSSLDFSGAHFGDAFEVRFGKNAPQPLRITGIAHDVSRAPGWMDHVVYGFVTAATLAQLGAPTELDELQFVVRDTQSDRDAVRRVANTVKGLAESRGKHVGAIDVPVPNRHEHAAQMDSLMLTQGAFGLLTLLVSGFLIVNLVSAMLAGQAREIGVMKALGASARQIAALYWTYALLLGLVAAAIALPAAALIGRPYAALKASMLNFSIDGFPIPWWAMALQLAVAVLLPLLSAAVPVARACRQPVSDLLRDPGIALREGDFHVRRRLNVPGLSRPLLLAIDNAFRRRQRLLLTLLSLAAGGAVFLGADTLRGAVRGSIDDLFANQRYDIVLRLITPAPAAELEATARQVAGVQRAQAFLRTHAGVRHADGNAGNTFSIVGVPVQTPMLTPQLIAGRWLQDGDGRALVVGRILLRDEPDLVAGAQTQLLVDGKLETWHVVGVVESGTQGVAYTPFETMAALQGDTRASMLTVAAQGEGSARLGVILRLRQELERQGMPVADSTLMSEMRRAVEDHLLMVVQFLGVMGWVMIAIGAMGLASTMSLAVLERTREIGVMRAIGARHGAIMGMIQLEGLVIAGLGALAALLLSMPVSVVLADAFGKVMFTVPLRVLPSSGGMLAWFGMVMLVSVLACAMPAWRATRIATARALSYE
jgi:putative ABC transport system permease protein